MCGIFGIIGKSNRNKSYIKTLAEFAKRRGSDSSGFMSFQNEYVIERADFDISKLTKISKINSPEVFLGIGRLITNDNDANQPFLSDDICVFHNGIVVNDNEIFEKENIIRKSKLDTEVFHALIEKYLMDIDIKNFEDIFLSRCKGTFSLAIALTKIGKLILFSNHGSLYVGQKEGVIIFSSERFHLSDLKCVNITNLNKEIKIIDIPICKNNKINLKDNKVKRRILVSNKKFSSNKEKILDKTKPLVVRCRRCVLPHTFPFIYFNEDGICNYCLSYKNRGTTKPKQELIKILEPYRKKDEPDCIVPFSGGRDSSYTLHLIVEELKLKPITYTYDWGMVTDLARRNISRMCSKLKVENIIVSANITRKRENIKKNLNAWLNSPHLGLISILTAGDKHFYRHTETIKKQTGINLNIWGICPIETTHFKAGFLGVPPDFCAEKVYMSGWRKQFDYQKKRFKAMIKSPGHFNSSLFDTLWGEYGRSLNEKKDYFHIFDYWRWDEKNIEKTILNNYDWEIACDTKSTWRIGDGTAAFYNYLYYTIAGFTEHDTFRSNQIRENQLTREEALLLINEENRPRYQNIRWYLDTLNLDYESVIKRINSMKTLY